MQTIRYFIVLFCCLVSSWAAARDIKVLTSIKPLQLIASAVLEGVAQPEVLLPPGNSPHHYALRPSDMSNLEGADVFYWVGEDMEVFLVKPLARRTKKTVAIETLPRIKLKHFVEETNHVDDHEHRAGAVDAHIWLSPSNAKVIAKHMADDFAQLDPANKAKYQQNLQLFEQALDNADKAIQQKVLNTNIKPFFVFHETYNYFEEHYGTHHKGVFSLSSNVQPSIRQVVAMQQQLKTVGNSCIFYEPPVKPKLADTLVGDLPVQMIMLDAMGTDAKTYVELLNNLANNLLMCQQD